MPTVGRDELLRCLAAVDAGLSAKDRIEQSSCYVLQGGRMWTFNDEVLCSVVLPEALGDVKCAVPAAPLRSLVVRLDDETFDVSVEDAELILKTKRRRAGIRVQTEVSLPVSEVTTPDRWNPTPEGFVEAVETVHQVAGRDDQLFVLTCVHLTPRGLEACDNYQAIRYRIETGLEESLLVKRDDLVKIVKLGMGEWGATQAWLHFRGSAGTMASCRRWNQSYPDLGPLLKVEGREGVLPRGLDDAVQTAEVFVDKKDDVVGLTVDLNSSRLLLRGEGPSGWYEERQRVEYDGEPISFRIAPRLLREVCRRSNRCIIGESKLRVAGERFVFISCLAAGDGKA